MNILLGEGDADIGRQANRALLAQGFDVEWQTCGRRTASRLRTGHFAAAIVDTGIADVAELCRELRDEGIGTPICLLDREATLASRLAGFRAGADDVLPRPFDCEELVARTAVMVRRSAAARGHLLSIGALSVDVPARQARIGADPLSLSRRAFDLLLCLARNAGQALTRDQIIDSAWGTDGEVTQNVVDVYVGYVRRALSEHAQAPAIETVRGIGFRLASRPKVQANLRGFS